MPRPEQLFHYVHGEGMRGVAEYSRQPFVCTFQRTDASSLLRPCRPFGRADPLSAVLKPRSHAVYLLPVRQYCDRCSKHNSKMDKRRISGDH